MPKQRTHYPTRNTVASPNGGETSLDMRGTYKIPPVIEAIRAGWVTSCQAIGVIAGLFATVEAQLIGVMASWKPEEYANLSGSRIVPYTLCILNAYAALSLTVCTALCIMLMLDELGSLPGRAWRRYERTIRIEQKKYEKQRRERLRSQPIAWPRGHGSADEEQMSGPLDISPICDHHKSDSDLLIEFGADRLWRWLVKIAFVCFSGALVCMFLQIVMFIWFQQVSLAAQIISTIITTFTGMPILLYVWWTVYGRSHRNTLVTGSV